MGWRMDPVVRALTSSGYASRAVPRIRSSIVVLLTMISLGCPATPAEQHQAAPKPTPESTRRDDAPEFVLAPASGDVAELVTAELERARTDDRLLLVYVGASWCEPCQYFHAAVEDGTLDDNLAGVRLLEFDLDQDKDRLAAAGYGSQMIPLFVVPGPDGRAGPRRTEGGVKGPAAVENLRARLVALLRTARADHG
jgi:thiol:disulfide interchange protein